MQDFCRSCKTYCPKPKFLLWCKRTNTPGQPEGFLSAVTEALQAGDAVKLTGFGSFEVKRRAARTGRNPQTKEMVEIPAQTVPVFKAGKGLKDSVAD